jgi:hypothetical protein
LIGKDKLNDKETKKLQTDLDDLLKKKDLTPEDLKALQKAAEKLLQDKEIDTRGLEVISKLVKNVPLKGNTEALKSYFDWLGKAIDAAIKGIKNIDEGKYRTYKGLRDSGMSAKDLEGGNNAGTENRYERRYQAEKLQKEFERKTRELEKALQK